MIIPVPVKKPWRVQCMDRNSPPWIEFMSVPKPSIWNCSYFTRWFSLFKLMTGLEPPPFFSTRNNVLMYCPWTGWAVLIAPFANISVTSRSTRAFNSRLNVGWTGGLNWTSFCTHSIWYPFLTTLSTQGLPVTFSHFFRNEVTRPPTASGATKSTNPRSRHSPGVS